MTPSRPPAPPEADSGRGFAVAAATCVVFGIIGWVFELWLFHGVPAQDWMVFYTAARAYFAGNLALIFDGEALTAALNHDFAGWLRLPLGPHPWVYPPPFLLLFLPFGALPPLLSLLAFIATGLAASLVAAWAVIGRGRALWAAIATLLLSPAVPFTVLTGQNAFYTAAVLVAGFGLLRRAPVVAGALLGVLSVKPQFALLVPVALLAARQWRALAGAAASAALLALVSVPVIGIDAWHSWLDLVMGRNEFYQAWVPIGRLNGTSVYACASLLGAPRTLANGLQAAATLAGAGFAYWAYRRKTAPLSLQLAVLLAATVLAAPHLSNSDAILSALAASLLATTRIPVPLRVRFLTIAAAVWISPLFNPPVLFRIGAVTPLLMVALLAAIAAVIRARSALEGAPAAAAI